MGSSRTSATKIQQQSRKRMSKQDLTSFGEYSLHPNGGALMCTVPQAGLQLFGLSKGDKVEVLISSDPEEIVIRPMAEGDEHEPE